MRKTYYNIFWAGVGNEDTNAGHVHRQKTILCHRDKIHCLADLKKAYTRLGFSDAEIAIIAAPFSNQDWNEAIRTETGEAIASTPGKLLNKAKEQCDAKNGNRDIDIMGYFGNEIESKLSALNFPTRRPSQPVATSSHRERPSSSKTTEKAQRPDPRPQQQEMINTQRAEAFATFKNAQPEKAKKIEKLKERIEHLLSLGHTGTYKVTLGASGDTPNISVISATVSSRLGGVLGLSFDAHHHLGVKVSYLPASNTINFSITDPEGALNFFDPLRMFDANNSTINSLFKNIGDAIEHDNYFGFYHSNPRRNQKTHTIDETDLRSFFDLNGSCTSDKKFNLRDEEKELIYNFVNLYEAYGDTLRAVDTDPSLTPEQKGFVTEKLKNQRTTVVTFMKEGNTDSQKIQTFCTSLKNELTRIKNDMPVQITGIFKKILGIIATVLTLGMIKLAAPDFIGSLFNHRPREIPGAKTLKGKIERTPEDGFSNVNLS